MANHTDKEIADTSEHKRVWQVNPMLMIVVIVGLGAVLLIAVLMVPRLLGLR